jgi:hypothetical protein
MAHHLPRDIPRASPRRKGEHRLDSRSRAHEREESEVNKKVVALGTMLLAAAVVMAFIATSAPAITSARQFRLIGTQAELSRIDVDPTGTSRGDQLVFSGALGRGREVAGRFDGHCIVTSTPRGDAGENRQQCVVTFTIGTANGETEIQAQGVGRLLAEDVFLSVTGGSQRFKNVRGQILVTFRSNRRATFDFDLIP